MTPFFELGNNRMFPYCLPCTHQYGCRPANGQEPNLIEVVTPALSMTVAFCHGGPIVVPLPVPCIPGTTFSVINV